MSREDLFRGYDSMGYSCTVLLWNSRRAPDFGPEMGSGGMLCLGLLSPEKRALWICETLSLPLRWSRDPVDLQ